MREQNALTRRFHRRILTLAAIAVFIIFTTPFVLGFLFLAVESEQQLELSCQSAQNQIEMLAALESISRTLGLPSTFDIPMLPAEC